MKAWSDQASLLRVGRISELLSILLVNRQIFNEACYIFTSINTFYFVSARHMLHILSKMSVEHRDQMERIAFNFPPELFEPNRMKEAFVMIARMKRLKCLSINIDQHALRGWWFYRRNHSMEDKLGFHLAAKIPERIKVVLQGDYPEFVMGQIRADAVVVEEPKKETTELVRDLDPVKQSVWERIRERIVEFVWVMIDMTMKIFGKTKLE